MSPAEALAERLVAVARVTPDEWVVWVAGGAVTDAHSELGARNVASDWRVALASALADCLPDPANARDMDPAALARARELARDYDSHPSGVNLRIAQEIAALAPRLLSALDAACRDRDAAEGALCDLMADDGRDLLERGRAEEREACAALVCWRCSRGETLRRDSISGHWLHPRPAGSQGDMTVRCAADQIRKRGSAPEPLPPARLRARVGAMEGVLRRLVAWAEEDRADAEQWAGIGTLADAAREALGEGASHAEP